MLIVSWDTLGEPSDGKVFVDRCDTCSNRNRGEVAEQIATALKADILLVRDDWEDGYPPSFKDAIAAPVKAVEDYLKSLEPKA